jgi:small subunit ribosomal protein S1
MENVSNNSENNQGYMEPEAKGTATQADDMAPGKDSTAKGTDIQEQSMEELMGLYEESLKRFEEGEVVHGTIISVDKDFVLVDVGYKSEGQIPINEFMDENGKVNVNINDRVEVMVELWDEEEERVILSKEKAAKVKVWDAIKEVYESDGIIEGVIINRVKGGFSVDVGVQAFLPGSQADLRPIRNLDEMVGKTFKFKV